MTPVVSVAHSAWPDPRPVTSTRAGSGQGHVAPGHGLKSSRGGHDVTGQQLSAAAVAIHQINNGPPVELVQRQHRPSLSVAAHF